MTTTPTWREALEFAAETKSSDWPARCQKMVDMARKALMSDLKQKPTAWTLKKALTQRGGLYKVPLWLTEPLGDMEWVPLYTIGAPQQAEAVPPGVVVDRGFRWDGEKQQHIPRLIIEFEPVPANSPCDAQGWRDRDQVAGMLAAAPKGQP